MQISLCAAKYFFSSFLASEVKTTNVPDPESSEQLAPSDGETKMRALKKARPRPAAFLSRYVRGRVRGA